MRTVVLTALALAAFAANSILCRMALSRSMIDAATFSTLRLASGAVTLSVLVAVSRGSGRVFEGSWSSAGALALYAIPFSFAYNGLTTGTGALILFGAVQVTMIAAALRGGERPTPLQWLGLGAAVGGLVYLVLPGLAAPDPLSAALMTIAGISWGIYTLRGRRIRDPLVQTSGNFVRAVPLVLLVSVAAAPHFHADTGGVALALLSGSAASGLGYAIWYAALPGLSSTRAAAVQLLVPVLAALGGVAFLAELVTARLAISTLLVIGGIAIVLAGRELSGRPTAPAPLARP
jgi:drug/metabolite transporter (DMT)-like permease